jgi:hypothetical protein
MDDVYDTVDCRRLAVAMRCQCCFAVAVIHSAVFLLIRGLGGTHAQRENRYHKLLQAVLMIVGQLEDRFVLPHIERFPYLLCGLVDPRVDDEKKRAIADRLVAARGCCLDDFSLNIKTLSNGDVNTLLPGGRLNRALLICFQTNPTNIVVECAFARAACQRASGRGKRQTLASMSAKHMLSEMRAAHLKCVHVAADAPTAQRSPSSSGKRLLPSRVGYISLPDGAADGADLLVARLESPLANAGQMLMTHETCSARRSNKLRCSKYNLLADNCFA